MTWVAQRRRDEDIVDNGKSTLWLELRKAIEASVGDFNRLYPQGTITARFKMIGEASLTVSAAQRCGVGAVRNLHVSLGHRWIATDTDRGARAEYPIVAQEREAVITAQGAAISPRDLSRRLLEPLLFPETPLLLRQDVESKAAEMAVSVEQAGRAFLRIGIEEQQKREAELAALIERYRATPSDSGLADQVGEALFGERKRTAVIDAGMDKLWLDLQSAIQEAVATYVLLPESHRMELLPMDSDTIRIRFYNRGPGKAGGNDGDLRGVIDVKIDRTRRSVFVYRGREPETFDIDLDKARGQASVFYRNAAIDEAKFSEIVLKPAFFD